MLGTVASKDKFPNICQLIKTAIFNRAGNTIHGTCNSEETFKTEG